MATVPEGANVRSITTKRSVEANRRIKVRAKAEVKERKGDQDPEATHNHRKALEVLGPAQSLESVLGLVEAPLPTLEARSAEIMWLASAPEARTVSGLTLLFANSARWTLQQREKLQTHAH